MTEETNVDQATMVYRCNDNRCPYCTSCKIHRSATDHATLTQMVYCEDCGRYWTECLDIVGVFADDE